MADRDLKDYYMRQIGSAKIERQSFMSHWEELSRFVKPRRGKFFERTDTNINRGIKSYQSIINSAATQALKISTSGMLAGTMSPARPWFVYETIDPDLMEANGVKDWLYKVENLHRRILSESNFYGMASTNLLELLLFGTSCMSHVDDFEDVARFYTHTIGSYMLNCNERYEVDTLIREYEWPASKIVQQFGIENVSNPIKEAVDKGNYLSWYPIVHIIEPNEDFRPDSPWAKDRAYKSVYFEPGSNERDKWLSRAGFYEFPVYATRWEVTGDDIYGTDCPGMTALGDIKQLQIEERRKAQAIDKMVAPVLGAPPSVKNNPVNQLPGNVIVYNSEGGQQKIEPLYQINPNIRDLRLDMDAVEQRINKAFFVDMFLAISNIEGIQPRNQLDLMQRNEERLLQLGPVLERIQNDWQDTMLTRLFAQCERAKILPPVPEALQGAPLKIRYVSTLVMAQRAVATQSIDRLFTFAAGIAQAGWPEIVRKLDSQQAVDEYAKAVGAPPGIIVPDDVVAQQEAQAAEQQQAMQQAEMAQTVANTAKMASDAKTDEANLLTETLS